MINKSLTDLEIRSLVEANGAKLAEINRYDRFMILKMVCKTEIILDRLFTKFHGLKIERLQNSFIVTVEL